MILSLQWAIQDVCQQWPQTNIALLVCKGEYVRPRMEGFQECCQDWDAHTATRHPEGCSLAWSVQNRPVPMAG
jgi:hypothetical protein